MKIPLLFLLLACLFFKGALHSQTIHAVLVADTENRQREFAASASADFRNMRRDLDTMARETGFLLRVYTVEGAEFTSAKVREALTLAGPQANDVFFFHFAGAGACDPAVSKDDRILRLGVDGKDTISTAVVAALMEQKNARLNIVLVDACGTLWDAGVGPHKGAGAQKIYRKLLGACGTLKAFSSKCEEFSYGDKTGGYFTNSYLAAIDHFITTPAEPVSWKALMEKTALLTRQRAMKIFRSQTPVFYFSKDFREVCLP